MNRQSVHPRSIRLVTVLVMVVSAFPFRAQAQPTVVVEADFNADTIGNPPDTSLPGGPEGDSIVLSTEPPGSSFVVVPSSGPLTDQPLEANRVAGPGSFNCLFQFPESAYACQTFTIKWCSVARTDIPTKFFVLRGVGEIFGAVNYRDTEITISTPTGEQPVSGWTVGTANCFEWHVDRSVPSQSLYIDDVLVADGLDGLSSATTDVESFSYEAALQVAFTFAIDDVEVSVDGCAVPLEATSWGTLKTTFR